jgi:hypothetical protein
MDRNIRGLASISLSVDCGVTSSIERRTDNSALMRHGGRTAELDLAQDERERHSAKRDQRQKPESVYVGGERCLRLDLLSDPLGSLLLRLENRAAMGEEVVRHLLQRVLIRRVRRDHTFYQPCVYR